MTEEEKEAIEELRVLQRAFGFNGVKDTQEYYYLRDEEPENYKTALAIETVLNLIKKQDKQIDLMARAWKQDDIRSIEEIKEEFKKKAEEENERI